jgi:hypothetical protein
MLWEFPPRPHFRKAQGIGSRLASLGGQLVLNFGRKNQLAIMLLGKENFLIISFYAFSKNKNWIE